MSPETFLKEVLKLEGDALSSGWYRCCCPIHKERKPSFGVKLEYPYRYNCFSCHASGNIVDLAAHVLQIPKKQAQVLVEDKIHTTLNAVTEWRAQEPEYISDLWVDILQEQLSDSEGLAYCGWRGIPKFILKAYRAGFDRKENRLAIPLTSVEDGKVLGFETRNFIGKEVRKYTFIKEGWKNRALVLPKQSLLDRPGVIIVEGVFDVFSVFKWLLKTGKLSRYIPVGLSGKTLSKKRLEFLSRYTHICLGFDRDSAGYTAEIQWAQKLDNVPLQRLTFDGSDPGESKTFEIKTLI